MRLFVTGLRNRFLVIIHDLAMIPLAWFGAYWLRFNLSNIPHQLIYQMWMSLPLVFAIQGLAYWYFGLYRGVWRFASIRDLERIVKAVLCGTVVSTVCIFFWLRLAGLPRSVFPIYALLLMSFLGGDRFIIRRFRERVSLFQGGQRVLVIGAGKAGEALIRNMLRDTESRYQPIVIVDDDASKLGLEIHGVRVTGDSSRISRTVKEKNIDLVLIAIPSLRAKEMRRIVELCEKTEIPYRTLPSLSDLASGNIDIHSIREVSLEDLLGRDPVQLDWSNICDVITQKTVVVTGGAGSIGSELCRQIAKLNPACLVVVDNSEFNLYSLDLELKKSVPTLKYKVILLDVGDRAGIRQLFETHQPSMVFHAAAYKHVPMLEGQTRVALKNNVLSTRILAEEAVMSGVEIFTLISTDKAVNPSNIMGASKRIAEIICQNFNTHAPTRFITVRFGNVLGSAGSVVPLFRNQLKMGGPLTVTDPNITRFFMTIPEATQLILQASAMGKGGEIFVLDMGEPIRIVDLAKQMIKLSGKQDIEIIYTGLRPGEKLHEELFHENEEYQATTHGKILRAKSREIEWSELLEALDQLAYACEINDEVHLQELFHRLVPELRNQFLVRSL